MKESEGSPVPSEAEITVAAEIRCPQCRGNRGHALIAVVCTDGSREWLVMNAQVQKSPTTPNPAPYQSIALSALVYGDRDRAGLTDAAQLDWMRDNLPFVVINLDKAEMITDPYPWVSVSCPRCAPTGQESSWFLDCRRIAGALKPSERVRLLAPEVSAPSAPRQVPDRDLGYRPPTSPSRFLRESRVAESVTDIVNNDG